MSFGYHLLRARDVFNSGGLVAYPTEGVWGLGCDPFNREAVETLLALKDRPWEKGLIVAVATLGCARPHLGGLTDEQCATVESSWPGPVTWLVPHGNRWPQWVTGTSDSIALRVSAYPLVQQLSSAVGGFVVSTSANPAGQPPAMTARDVRRYFGNQVDLIMPGKVQGLRKPSAIRNAITGEIARV